MVKGCPLLEYIDLHVNASENHFHTELITLASLQRLRSVFIYLYVGINRREMTLREIVDLRVSLIAIVEQGLLEVRNISLSL